MRTNEIDKVEMVVVEEKQIGASISSLTSIEIEDQNVSTKQLSVITRIPVAFSLVPLISIKKALVINEKDGKGQIRLGIQSCTYSTNSR